MKRKLMFGDCLKRMKEIPDKSVDMCLTDPPYGTTACKWDAVIPFEPMWKELHRIVKDNGAICLFGSEPFSSALRMSNIKMFKYDWIWEKNRGANFVSAKYQPMKEHEIVSIFSLGKHSYYPIKEERTELGAKRVKSKYQGSNTGKRDFLRGFKDIKKDHYSDKLRFPRSIQKFKVQVGLHPTQKPVALLEYLIKTYTLENETVLDFTMGSGSTGVACKNLNRNFVGIEKDREYFKIAKQRIKDA
jgi:site-specific DNA-methyltransferase (adenine-specific)